MLHVTHRPEPLANNGESDVFTKQVAGLRLRPVPQEAPLRSRQ